MSGERKMFERRWVMPFYKSTDPGLWRGDGLTGKLTIW